MRVKYAGKVERELSLGALASYFEKGYQPFLNMNWGEFNRTVDEDTGVIRDAINSVLRLFTEFISIFVICAYLFYMDIQLAIIVMILSLVCLAVLYFYYKNKMYTSGKIIRKYNTERNQLLNQIYRCIKDILILKKEAFFMKQYEKNRVEYQKAQCEQVVGSESPAYVIEGICVSGIMIAVSLNIAANGMNPNLLSVLAGFAVGAFRILPSIGRVSTCINSIVASSSSIEELCFHMFEDGNFADNKVGGIANKYIHSIESKKEGDLFKKALIINNISFSYGRDEKNILKNINIAINKGMSIGIIGASGAGKSTLIDVILGLLKPIEGRILMDGEDICSIEDKWASVISYVPQTIFLSDTTIRENIAFGINVEDIDDKKIWSVLEKTELYDFVSSLKETIYTEVGDMGIRLSGGQRQRVAIARALYHSPEILVLDEATSALDDETEKAIMQSIERLKGNITLITVAHRITTLRSCDKIYEVIDGNLVERKKKDLFYEY